MNTSVARSVTIATAAPRRGNRWRCTTTTIGLSSSAMNPATTISRMMSLIR
jgi:hypothetical protein